MARYLLLGAVYWAQPARRSFRVATMGRAIWSAVCRLQLMGCSLRGTTSAAHSAGPSLRGTTYAAQSTGRSNAECSRRGGLTGCYLQGAIYAAQLTRGNIGSAMERMLTIGCNHAGERPTGGNLRNANYGARSTRRDRSGATHGAQSTALNLRGGGSTRRTLDGRSPQRAACGSRPTGRHAGRNLRGATSGAQSAAEGNLQSSESGWEAPSVRAPGRRGVGARNAPSPLARRRAPRRRRRRRSESAPRRVRAKGNPAARCDASRAKQLRARPRRRVARLSRASDQTRPGGRQGPRRVGAPPS